VILSKISFDIFLANQEPRGIKQIKIIVDTKLRIVISKLKKS
jgi:hypothetical protein